MTIMSCKGYDALVDYDPDAGLFHGEVLALKDVIAFQGHSVSELRKAFANSVDDYIEFCRMHGEDPERPHSPRADAPKTRPCPPRDFAGNAVL